MKGRQRRDYQAENLEGSSSNREEGSTLSEDASLCFFAGMINYISYVACCNYEIIN